MVSTTSSIDTPKLRKISRQRVRRCATPRIAVAVASAILTHFRFTVAGSAIESEPARFNDHLIAHKENAARVSASLQELRGHCHVIKRHVDGLRGKAKSLNLDRLLLLFGIDSAAREQEVATALEKIYDDEMQGYCSAPR